MQQDTANPKAPSPTPDQRALPPGLGRRPRVGVVLAFIGQYDSVRLLARFLHHAGCDVVTSQVSTAPIIEAGTTLASADFCFPVRVYVGHVHELCRLHPDLDAVLAPNLWREREGTATCSKYRDVGGIAMRSLAGVVPYLEGLTGERPAILPRFIRPTIKSMTYEAMRNLAFDVYAEAVHLPPTARLGFFLPPALRQRFAPDLTHVEMAFDRAWREVTGRPLPNLERMMAAVDKPRLAVVGRRYMVNDAALTADLKPWFQRRGALVLTASDVSWAELEEAYWATEGYYDTHREGQAFIDWATDRVDGFVVLGSFGCHPDAFQVDTLADYARAKGRPAWTFRFDETVGTAGFQTRFETIYGFLEQQRDRRVRTAMGAAAGDPDTDACVAGADAYASTDAAANAGDTVATGVAPDVAAAPAPGSAALRPLFVWPYMGEELNLALEEAFVQTGLRHLAHPPRPIDGATLQVGNRRYSESCSPFAAATGSLMETVRDAVRTLRSEATARGDTSGTGTPTVEPRRIIALMLRGQGPCTFGWYAIAQSRHLPADLAGDLTDGHTLEFLTMDFDTATDFLHQLSRLGDSRRLAPVVDYVDARLSGAWTRLGPITRARLLLRFQLAVRSLLRVVWAKLTAAEEVRARSLLVRAHELHTGETVATHARCQDLLRQAHTPAAIRRARRRALGLLDAVPQDRRPKPRVASVGEIYVALTSFANRGVVENLLGRQGIEVVEGITTSEFVHHSLREIQRRALANHPWVRPLRVWLEARNIHWLDQRPRDLGARPWLEWEIGGEGMPGLAAARRLVERGCDGIIHTYPFKCMPEGIARDAYKELSDLYGVRYLSMSFDKELDVERVKTEVHTFAALLQAQLEQRSWLERLGLRLHRQRLGRRMAHLYARAKRVGMQARRRSL